MIEERGRRYRVESCRAASSSSRDGLEGTKDLLKGPELSLSLSQGPFALLATRGLKAVSRGTTDSSNSEETTQSSILCCRGDRLLSLLP